MINFNENEDFNRAVFTIEGGSIVQHVLSELCRAYADETTTPIGIAPRYHTRECIGWIYDENWYSSKELADEAKADDLEGGDDYGAIEPGTQHALWDWGFNGNNPSLVEIFNSAKEAKHGLMLAFKYYLFNGNNKPEVFDTREEASEALRQWSEDNA
jgi:hypothetical protein